MKFVRLERKVADQVLRCFAEDLTAAQAARILGVNRKTVNKWYDLYRQSVKKSLESAASEMKITLRDEDFKSFYCRRLGKFNGIPRKALKLHRLETQFRYIHRNRAILEVLREIFAA